MLHLFRNTNGSLNGTFDIALVVKGKYIVGSHQGYERKQGGYHAIGLMMKEFSLVMGGGAIPYLQANFQDDTVTPSIVRNIRENSKGFRVLPTEIKPKKPYVPAIQK